MRAPHAELSREETLAGADPEGWKGFPCSPGALGLTGLRVCCSYEQQGRVRRVVKAQQLWYAIIESQTETGTPYMLYKDSCNRKSNQQNLGTIKCSNLCTEIVEYTSKEEVGAERSWDCSWAALWDVSVWCLRKGTGS